jgi:uncharacterized protein (UPF0332 family)
MTTQQFDWLSYLVVADHLRHQQGEGFYRSAVSRAYYGVFGHTRTVLEGIRGIPFPRGRNVHRDVINALKNDPRPEVASLGQDLEYLRDERNDADYRNSIRFNESRAKAALSRACSIRNGISAAFP